MAVHYHEMGSAPDWIRTFQDLKETFHLWGVGNDDWSVEKLSGSAGVKLVYFLPYDPRAHRVTSLGQRYYERNFRCIYQHISAMQRDAIRGVRADIDGVEFLKLPPGTREEAEAQFTQPPPRPRRPTSAPLFRGLGEACEYLGVHPKAPQEVVNGAYRALMRSANGDEAKLKLVNGARDFIYERRGWAVDMEAQE